VLLVRPVQVEGELAGERGERRQHPRGRRVRIDRDRQPREPLLLGADLAGRVGGEQRDLPGQAQDRAAGLGHPHRLAAHQQHPAGRGLQRPQPLAHRRRRHVQDARGRLQRSAADGGVQRAELCEVEVHGQGC
jgi:hypothetical protein